MIIGLVTGEYPPIQGGVGDFTREMAKSLAKLGCHVCVVTERREGEYLDCVPSQPYEIQRVTSPTWGWRDIWQVQRATAKMELVNIQYQAAAYGKMRPPLHFLPRVLKSPSVVTFHDLRAPYLFPKAGMLRQHAILELARGADGVIATNSEDFQTLSRTTNLKHLTEIPIGSNIDYAPPLGFDPERWRMSHGVGEDEFLIGYFGFLNASKGGESVIRALAVLAQDSIPIRLVLIGGSAGTTDPTNVEYDERIGTLAHSLGVSGHIVRTGFLPPAETSLALLSCHVMVLPYRDGASVRRGSLMACLNHGLPTITTHPTSPWTQLEHGVNTYLVSTDSPHAIAAAIKELREDPDQRTMIGNGAKDLSENFTWHKIAASTLEFFQEVAIRR